MSRPGLLLLLASAASLQQCVAVRDASQFHANPIRKVVTMLQAMQKKVTEEGEAEKELYEKFMCYCKTSGGQLTSSIQAADDKVSQLGSSIKEAEMQKAQLEADLKEAQDGRAAGKSTLEEATAIRDKEATVYSKTKADYEANIAAINKAVAAIEQGIAGAFLQTDTAKKLQRLVLDMNSAVLDENREKLMAFFQGGESSEYVPQSGQIVGILKQLGDEMKKGLEDATGTETSSIATYEDLEAAKKKEVVLLTTKIESLLGRIGELGVSTAEMKNDLTDTESALLADKEFLSNLETGCASKTAEWEEREKTRAEELLALSETIKVLNDDDALELFKKTLPSAASSFVQAQGTTASLRKRALALLHRGEKEHSPNRVPLDLIALALSGKKIGFEKVIAMIDEMVETLKTEQVDDDKKKAYCGVELDTSDDQKKILERTLADAEAAIEQTKEGIATLKEEAAALTAGIKALDKSVADATEQRKQEHKEYTELMASDSAAKKLLTFAKNRLYQFYNPKMYKAPAKRELSAEDQIVENFGGEVPTPAPSGIAGTGIAVLAEVAAHRQRANGEASPPPPPETFSAYTTKVQESKGVVAMIDLLIKDLDKEMTEAGVNEEDSQKDYEKLMDDSASKRAADSKSLTQKQKATADMEAELEQHKDTKASTTKELAATLKYISSLHGECDWLLQYYSVRKSARDSEIDALGKAKAVLSGADYTL